MRSCMRGIPQAGGRSGLVIGTWLTVRSPPMNRHGCHEARIRQGDAYVNYAATVSITSSEMMGWLRTAVGLALIAAPGAPMRLAGQQKPAGADLLLMRTIGIRDLVLGLGTVAAARSDDMTDLRRWTATALASDSLDVAASLASFRSIGKRDSWGAAILALTFVCGDLQARRHTPAPQGETEAKAG
jgi:hypothetical protein